MSTTTETLWYTHILAARVAPNPVQSGAALLLQVRAIDVFGGEQTEVYLSGEFLSGEV